MNITTLSERYPVRELTEQDAETVFRLCRKNPQYYEYCPPFVTPDSVLRDMRMLPPGKGPEDKHYLGFFNGDDLIAVLDLINGYPNPETAFFGFFMTAASIQHQGIGSRIIADVCVDLKKQGFREIRLCRVEGNPQPEAFWRKNGFLETGQASREELYTVIILRKEL